MPFAYISSRSKMERKISNYFKKRNFFLYVFAIWQNKGAKAANAFILFGAPLQYVTAHEPFFKKKKILYFFFLILSKDNLFK